ncbi:uncharacterized protein LY89DRAFT_755993 [Mollisia scopiformis]|uniref:DUF6594 domain-containing protein n=1 Tax=Mollisia scopiformis TaxID=149040 RepID=A0A194WY53_MOLSC|nr:uncharacterized protein LY89DRAFT_755993 [Mollisia scopiformis]KUJ12860.1 hypothetical protein LY89DRAFT_755993 [Mollisia scopiformis]
MKGYAKLGWLMGTFPDASIMRRFSILGAQNLLYLQAELTSLEADLRKYAAEDDDSLHQDRSVYSLDWLALKESIAEHAESGNEGRQWETMLAIRNKLEEYHLSFLNEWMSRTDMGNVYLLGNDSTIWTDSALRPDLVTLKSRTNDDLFYRWISEKIIKRFHRLLGHRFKKSRSEEQLSGTVIYGDSSVRRLTKSIATILACMLPILSTVILYLVQNMSKRLGIVTVFTAIFSISLVTLTNAEMADIFAATAA